MSTTLHENTIVAAVSEHEGNDTLKDLAETVVIRFAEPDEDNPFDWRPAKKWYPTFQLFIEGILILF